MAVFDKRTPISRNSLKISIPIKYWDDKRQEVKVHHEVEHEKINYLLNQHKSEFLAANKKAVRTNRDCFIEFAKEHLEKEYSNEGTKIKYTTVLNSLKKYVHDVLGYNYRMPNLNAALACAQLEQLETFIQNKRNLALEYDTFFESKGINFRKELPNTKANYWLMCLELENKKDRDSFLKETNENNVMTRPIWQLIFKSPLYSNYHRDSQENAIYLEDRIVNIPSSVRL